MLHRFHRISALIIGGFVVVHLLNHLMALRGIESHIAYMEEVRRVSRVPGIEALLIACVGYQALSGCRFIIRRWGERRGFFDRLQAVSGAYLAFFLLVHVSSVLYGRLGLGQDTNFFFAAAGLHIGPYPVFFVPYYGLAVAAVFAHVACAFHYLGRSRFRERTRNLIGYASVVAGLLLAGVLVAAFSGAFYPVHIPPEYQARYR